MNHHHESGRCQKRGARGQRLERAHLEEEGVIDLMIDDFTAITLHEDEAQELA